MEKKKIEEKKQKNKKKIEKEKISDEKKIEEFFSPSKYIVVGILLLGVVLVALTLARIYESTQNIDYSKSYLVAKEIVPEITCNDLANSISGERSFIFVTHYDSEEEYELEKDLKGVIGEYRLKDDFFVFKDDQECGSIKNIEEGSIKEALKLSESIDTVPTILYYKDGEFVDYVKREDPKMIEAADFVKLLDIYEITK